jgi:ribonuclease BN (tRNA processing enzyme)
VILVNGTPYVVDCGDGVARQFAFTNVPLATLCHIFITHQHSDHNAELLLARESGIRRANKQRGGSSTGQLQVLRRAVFVRDVWYDHRNV